MTGGLKVKGNVSLETRETSGYGAHHVYNYTDYACGVSFLLRFVSRFTADYSLCQ